ncbi:MAG TPA: hypothetical protein VJG32_06315 [Anaerolineae bacterium]|nr:hypothetical protein [Anaerolineae bacterium]
MVDKPDEALFVAGKAKWLLENARKLTPDQRALLLAVADLEQNRGRQLSAQDQEAIDELAEAQEGYDPNDIERAVQHMLKAKAKRKVVDWPSGLWARVRKKGKG